MLINYLLNKKTNKNLKYFNSISTILGSRTIMASSLSSPYNGTSVATHILDGYANLVCDVKGHEKQRIVYICANATC